MDSYGGNYGGGGYGGDGGGGYGGGYDQNAAAGGGYGYGAENAGGGGNGGGGFVSPQGSNANSSQGGGRVNRDEQTYRTLTIKQILDAKKLDGGDTWQCDGADIHHCVFVGCVVSKEERNTHRLYSIEDGTGRVSVKEWNQARDDDESEAADPAEKSGPWNVREGDYVCCTASIKEFDGVKTLRAFGIRPIRQNFNEVMHFQLQAIFEHLHFTKGALPDPRKPQSTVGQMNAAHAPEFGGRGPAITAGNDVMSDKIIKIIRSCDDDTGEGVSISTITGELKRMGGDVSVLRRVVAEMCDDGLLYSTIDDDHFATTTAE